MPRSRVRRAVSILILASFGGTVLWSGVACLAGQFELSLWPWHKAWYMFSWSDDHLHKMEVVGELEDASSVRIDLDRWFKYPVAFDTLRADEVAWSYDNFRKLALFAAHKHNESAAAGRKVVRVSLNDVAWRCAPGTRVSYAEAPELQKTRRKLVDRLPCAVPGGPGG